MHKVMLGKHRCAHDQKQIKNRAMAHAQPPIAFDSIRGVDQYDCNFCNAAVIDQGRSTTMRTTSCRVTPFASGRNPAVGYLVPTNSFQSGEAT
jgi:hypothetical protein